MKHLPTKIFLSFLIILIGNYYFGNINDSPKNNYWINLLLHCATYFIAIMVVIKFNIRNIPKKKESMLQPQVIIPIIIGVSGLFLVNYFLPILLRKILGMNLLDNNNPKIIYFSILKFLPLMAFWVFIEEIVFRRFFAQMIFNKNGVGKAIWLSSLMFSISHIFIGANLTVVLIAGVFLAYLYFKINSILLNTAAHILYNLLDYFMVDNLNKKVAFYNSYEVLFLFTLLGLSFIFFMQHILNKQMKIQ